jgi:hypothetical protein
MYIFLFSQILIIVEICLFNIEEELIVEFRN